MVKRSTLERIKQVRKDIKSMTHVRELIEYFPESTARKFAYWLLIIVAASPLYVLFRSVFLKSHERVDLLTNQRLVGTYLYTLLQEAGYLGLFLVLFLLAKSVLKFQSNPVPFTKNITQNLFPLLLSLMLFWSVVSCVFSERFSFCLRGTAYRRDGLRTYFIYAGIFACGYMVKNKKSRLIIMKCFASAATMLSITMLMDLEAINRIFSLYPKASVFHNINHFAYFLCLAAMNSVALALHERTEKTKFILWLFTFAVHITALITNGSFGPYLAVTLGLIFVVVLAMIYASKATAAALVVLAVFVSLSIGMNFKNNFLAKEAINLTNGINNILEKNEKASKAGSNRWGIWVHGMQYALEKPLFGYGPDNLGDRYRQDGIHHDRPHNEIIQFAASLGIPAALFYISAMFVYFWSMIRNRKSLDGGSIGCVGVILAYLISSMFGNTMFYTTPYYFLFLGLFGNLFQPTCCIQSAASHKVQPISKNGKRP